jgi:type IV secretion system protein VirB2
VQKEKDMKKLFRLSGLHGRRLLAAGAAVAIAQLAFTDVAHAQSVGQAFTPVQAIFQAVVDFVNGPFGRLCGIIAVMSLGFLAWMGRLSWIIAGSAALGIGFVFGAPGMVDALIALVGSGT